MWVSAADLTIVFDVTPFMKRHNMMTSGRINQLKDESLSICEAGAGEWLREALEEVELLQAQLHRWIKAGATCAEDRHLLEVENEKLTKQNAMLFMEQAHEESVRSDMKTELISALNEIERLSSGNKHLQAETERLRDLVPTQRVDIHIEELQAEVERLQRRQVMTDILLDGGNMTLNMAGDKIEQLQSEVEKLRFVVMKEHKETCVHHNDKERSDAGCPVCMKAKNERLELNAERIKEKGTK